MRKQQRSRTYTASSARVPAEARRKAVSKTQSSVAIRYWVILSLVIGVVIYTSFSLLLRYTDLQKTNQENRALSAAIDSLTAEHDTLSMNLTPYLDPTRIETLARQRLHMDHPSSAQVILAEEAQSPEKTAEGSDPQLAALASAASQR